MNELRMCINGDWVASESGEHFDAYNPATLQVIARVPQGTRKDADRAVEAAHRAKETMAQMSVIDRVKLLHRIADVMESRLEELAKVLSEDQGKPYHSEALPEVEVAAHSFRDAAEYLRFMKTPVIHVHDPNKRVWSIRQPRGVYGVITPRRFRLIGSGAVCRAL